MNTQCAASTVRLGAASIPDLPAGTLRRLRRRGVACRMLAEEDAATHRARIETALLALFRDERQAADFDALHAFTVTRLFATLSRERRGAALRLDPVELVQDVYINVYRYAGSFRDERPRSFQVWIAAIARNLVRRHMSRSRAVSLQAFPEDLQEPADKRPGPARLLQSVEEQRALRDTWLIFLAHYSAAFETLGPRDRQALELVEIEGLSYRACCDELGVRMSNMKMIMFRARKRIRNHMLLSMGLTDREAA